MSGKNKTKEQGTKKPFADNIDLPSSYNRTKLTLIARDPYWVYAYWEIAQSSIDRIRDEVGSEIDRGVYALRVYDISCIDFNGSNANRQFDIDVGHGTNNWYVNLWNDCISLCADIGLRLPDGRFFMLARSNFVVTPRANPSNRSEEIWLKREAGTENKPPYVFADFKKNNPGSGIKNSPRRHNSSNGKRMSLTEDDIRAYYSRLSPLLKDVISTRLNRTPAGKKNNPRPVDVAIIGSNNHNFFTNQFTRRVMLGASESKMIGGSESVGGASEQNIKGRKFFFELNTELIVYGRTEPDAKVMFGDKRISLRSDGTFSMRFALPDGRIPLPFTATSADNVETREISTGVEREKTRYA